MRPWRTVLFGASFITALVLVCAIAAVAVLQSGWFREQVRLRIIAAVENATGGRVELKSFGYQWRSLTADVTDFVLHGTEPEDAPPLFQAQHIQVRLKIVSILKKDIDVEELDVNRPEIYVLVRQDGTTNVPAPKMKRSNKLDIPQELFKLAIGHFELRNGAAEINQKKIGLDIRGDRLIADVHYDSAMPAYIASLSSAATHVASRYSLPFAADLQAKVQFARDRILVDQFTVSLPNSQLTGTGLVSPLTAPHAKFDIDAEINIEEIGKLLKQPDLRSGLVDIKGQALFENGTYTFSGSARGSRVGYRTRLFSVENAGFQSTVVLDPEGLVFPKLDVRALGAYYSGELTLKKFRDLHTKGRVSRLSVREAGKLMIKRSLPWDGSASGSVELEGRLGNTPQDVSARALLDITPGPNGIPISGKVQLGYQQRGNLVRFDESELHLPNTSVAFAGTLGQELQVSLTSSDLDDAKPVEAVFRKDGQSFTLPVRLDRGDINFKGTVFGPLQQPVVSGHLSGNRVRYERLLVNDVNSDLSLSADHLRLANISLTQGTLKASGSGQIALDNWTIKTDVPLNAQVLVQNANLGRLAAQLGIVSRGELRGRANLFANVNGTLQNPQGTGTLRLTGLDAKGQQIDSLTASLRLAGNRVEVDQGTVKAADAAAKFEAAYQRSGSDWTKGRLSFRFDSDDFRLQDLATVRAFEPELQAGIEAHLKASLLVSGKSAVLESVNGAVRLKGVSFSQTQYGNIVLSADTVGHTMQATFDGNLRDSNISGNLKVELEGDYQGSGNVQLSAIQIATISSLVPSWNASALPFNGFVEGSGRFSGPLARPAALSASIRLEKLQLTPHLDQVSNRASALDDITLRISEPVTAEYRDGTVAVQTFHMSAKDTQIQGGGRIPFGGDSGLDFKLNGVLNLQLLRMFGPNVVSKGTSRINTEITGSLRDPAINGTVEFHNGSFYVSDITNGVDHAEGLIRFDRNRATIQRLTAQSGGGNVSASGFVTFGGPTPMMYRLGAKAEGMRVRYSGVSITSDADLKYSGTNEGGLLAGNVTVTKAAFNPSTDIGSLFATSSEPIATPSAEDDFLHRVRLEVNVASSPSLQLATSLSQDVQTDVDLRLRGTIDHPAVLGRFSVNEGQIQFFGNKYTINRGEVNFFNPLKIEPVLDLDLETQARGVTVNITVSGTLEKLNINYRSDPPLQSREIIALLATGRAPDLTSGVAAAQTLNRSGTLGAGANTILGSALSPVSGRLEKFFGVTHLKIDPMLQGIENVPQARLTLEQQISKQITVTYVTNLSRTSEQIYRMEWAFSREYSFIAIRDENGLFGVDLQYKRRYK
jgi:translocation and assembly module TamB